MSQAQTKIRVLEREFVPSRKFQHSRHMQEMDEQSTIRAELRLDGSYFWEMNWGWFEPAEEISTKHILSLRDTIDAMVKELGIEE